MASIRPSRPIGPPPSLPLYEAAEEREGEDSPSGSVRFHQATALTRADVEALQETVRRPILRDHASRGALHRHGLLEEHTVREMLSWEHGGGFSLDASVRIAAHDRAGLERLLRYCARPPFALERLEWGHSEAEYEVLYRLPKRTPDGRTVLRLSPLEFLDRLAALIPPPRVHRYRYHGVLAPNSRSAPSSPPRLGRKRVPRSPETPRRIRVPSPPRPRAADPNELLRTE